MADTLRGVPVVALTASFQTIYEVPADTTFVVGLVHLCNTLGSPVAVRMCLVPAAGSPVEGNALAWDYGVAVVAGSGILELGRGMIWNAGDTLQVLGEGVSIQLSGIERSSTP